MTLTEKTWIPRPRCCWCEADFVRTTILGKSVFVCPHAKCRARCEHYATIVDGALVNFPVPKQTELLELIDSHRANYIYYGGARGGSKSHALRHLAHLLCRRYRDFRVLLLRRTLAELEKYHIEEAQREAPRVGAVYTKNRLDYEETESFLQFGHCQHPKDVQIWLSTEYDLILFDELITFEEGQFIGISGSTGRRERTDDWPGLVVASSNPGGAWIEDLFITKRRDKIEFPDYDPSQFAFIPAVLEDNPYVKPGYVNFLANLPKEIRDAYRWGSWDIFAGQFFKEFRKPIHIATLEIPKELPRIGGMRWGYAKQGLMLFAVALPDGRLHIEAELPFVEKVPAIVAQDVKTLLVTRGWTMPIAYGNQEMGDDGAGGEDVFETLAQHGLFVYPSRHEPMNGWQRVRDWLQMTMPAGPALTTSPACETLLRTLPRLEKDDKNPEDIKRSDRDAAAHALRFIVMSRPRPQLDGGKMPYPEQSAGALFEQARMEAMRSQR